VCGCNADIWQVGEDGGPSPSQNDGGVMSEVTVVQPHGAYGRWLTHVAMSWAAPIIPPEKQPSPGPLWLSLYLFLSSSSTLP